MQLRSQIFAVRVLLPRMSLELLEGCPSDAAEPTTDSMLPYSADCGRLAVDQEDVDGCNRRVLRTNTPC